MASIFVSHSSKDGQLVNLFSRAFATTNVGAIFEEFIAIDKGAANASRIANNIRQSNAVFIVLGKNVEQLRHTRDWVNWEGGVAAGIALQTKKEVWVFEPTTEMESLTVVIPYLNHYVSFDPEDMESQSYISKIVNSYDYSHVLPAAVLGAGGGALVAEKKSRGSVAFWSALGGLAVAAMSGPTRPMGLPTSCPICNATYNVHLAAPQMRCPVCSNLLVFSSEVVA